MSAPRSVVVVGASAGGVEALTAFARDLPPDLAAAVLVVLHMAPGGTSVLGGILDRAGALPAAVAEDGEPLEEGRIFVARPDFHLVCEDGGLRLDPGPRENGHRPAVDPLFRSAADAYGPRVIAVVLSGSRDDGTAGAAAVRAAGGRVAVQDPDDALYPSMPASVLASVGVDLCATPGDLARAVDRWAAEALVTERADPQGTPRHEAGEPGSTGLTCPECGGAIYLDRPDGVTQFTCHTGHVYSPASFADDQEQVLESALWGAVRRLDERAALLRKMAEEHPLTHTGSQEGLEGRAREAEAQADVIRDLIARRVAEPT